MKTSYLVVSGTVFGVVAILHAIRVVTQWPVIQVGTAIVPVWLSWLGLLVSGGLSVWAFRLRGEHLPTRCGDHRD